MKKFISVIVTLSVLLGCAGLTVFAEEAEPLSAEVYVTVADKGTLVLACEKITVTDTDSDGALTVNDALYAAHEAKYEGGAEVGYASAYGDYGLSLNRLWGDNSGSFGYYVNNASAWSLEDTVKEGDCVNAFVYTDTVAWSDIYCWFDATSVNTDAGKEITLILSGAGYDGNWNPITVPVEGATVTLNGEKTASITDSEGKVTFEITDGGAYIISAVSNTQVLVPPVCIATVSAKEPTPPANVVTSPDDTEATTGTESKSESEIPKTSDSSDLLFAVFFVLVSLGVSAVLKNKLYDK